MKSRSQDYFSYQLSNRFVTFSSSKNESIRKARYRYYRREGGVYTLRSVVGHAICIFSCVVRGVFNTFSWKRKQYRFLYPRVFAELFCLSWNAISIAGFNFSRAKKIVTSLLCRCNVAIPKVHVWAPFLPTACMLQTKERPVIFMKMLQCFIRFSERKIAKGLAIKLTGCGWHLVVFKLIYSFMCGLTVLAHLLNVADAIKEAFKLEYFLWCYRVG